MGLIHQLLPKRNIDADAESVIGERNFPITDFIPYAVFYNDHTILTKNGELMQTIRIPLSAQGLPSENAEHTHIYLRDIIRRDIGAHLTSHEFSHWLHVFREREAIAPLSQPRSEFARRLQKDWLDSQHTQYNYHNVCYLTLLIQGQSAKMFSMNEYRQAGKKQKNRKFREAYLEDHAVQLESAVQSFIADLSQHFTVERLGMVERSKDGQSVYCSEQLEWLHRLINLSQTELPVGEVDLSQQLETSELIFGFDAMEARTSGHKRFASVISLKHYHELPPELFDRFLQMPIEMIVTQASHFVTCKKALSELDSIRKVLQQSEDGFIAKHSGFIDAVESNHGLDTDFSSQQTTVMVITDDYKEMDRITVELQTVISNLGLLSVREDIKMEEIFWSQLPGNFEFLRRLQSLPSNKVDGLARLNYYPTGKDKGHWGEPISIFPTVTRTPYLFHLHQGKVGHSIVLDFNSFPDALGYRLTHFIAAAASKQVSRVILFDRHGSGEMFVNAMDGHYGKLGGENRNISLNPLMMECVPGNQGFLAAWLSILLNIASDDNAGRDAIRACVGQGWNSQSASAGYTGLVNMMQEISPELAGKLRDKLKCPVFGACMESGVDNFNPDAPLVGFNIHTDAYYEESAVALLALILHRTIMTLDGKPTLIVIKDAWDVLDHPFFATRLQSLLDMLTERNAAVMFTMRQPEKLSTSEITPIIMGAVATKLVLPDDIPCDYFAELMGYGEEEDRQLNAMERQKGDLLIVHGDEIIVTSIELRDQEEHAILSGDAKTLQAMKSAQ